MNIHVENLPLRGRIRAISSKSDVHRFLIAAALAKGDSVIHFTTLSDDIAATLRALRALGAQIRTESRDGGYTARISGIRQPPPSCMADAGECGTTARLLLPVLAALCNSALLTGAEGLRARPFGDLCAALRQNGTECLSDRLPIQTRGKLQSGTFTIRGDISSQYISGLLFALPLLDGDSRIVLTARLVSAGYIDMTLDTLKRFGITVIRAENGFIVPGGQTYTPVSDYTAEGDWSNAGFWLGAGALGGDITVEGLFLDSRQRDRDLLTLLEKAGAVPEIQGDCVHIHGASLHALAADGSDIPDALVPFAAVLACAEGESKISGGARLKIKESDRLKTTAALISSLGGDIRCTEDGFRINGKASLRGGECRAANDHRIAMAAAILASRTQDGVTILGAEAVNKSYPTFFEDFEKLGGKYSVITNE